MSETFLPTYFQVIFRTVLVMSRDNNIFDVVETIYFVFIWIMTTCSFGRYQSFCTNMRFHFRQGSEAGVNTSLYL
jgi:hypothetical protein